MLFARYLIAALALIGLVPAHAASLPPPPSGAPTGPGGPAMPDWLAGTWVMENGARWGDEVWTNARGGIMLGAGRTGFGAELEGWEAMRIIRRKDGSLSLMAQPKDGPTVEFAMVVAGPSTIEFANAAHDFPQRIRYWREGQLLMSEISRMDGSDAVRANFRPVETAPPKY